MIYNTYGNSFGIKNDFCCAIFSGELLVMLSIILFEIYSQLLLFYVRFHGKLLGCFWALQAWMLKNKKDHHILADESHFKNIWKKKVTYIKYKEQTSLKEYYFKIYSFTNSFHLDVQTCWKSRLELVLANQIWATVVAVTLKIYS